MADKFNVSPAVPKMLTAAGQRLEGGINAPPMPSAAGKNLDAATARSEEIRGLMTQASQVLAKLNALRQPGLAGAAGISEFEGGDSSPEATALMEEHKQLLARITALTTNEHDGLRLNIQNLR